MSKLDWVAHLKKCVETKRTIKTQKEFEAEVDKIAQCLQNNVVEFSEEEEELFMEDFLKELGQTK